MNMVSPPNNSAQATSTSSALPTSMMVSLPPCQTTTNSVIEHQRSGLRIEQRSGELLRLCKYLRRLHPYFLPSRPLNQLVAAQRGGQIADVVAVVGAVKRKRDH